MEGIYKIFAYTKKLEVNQSSSFYYLISKKNYSEDINNCKPGLAIQYLQKLVSNFYKNHINKPTATSLFLDPTLVIVNYNILPNINGK